MADVAFEERSNTAQVRVLRTVARRVLDQYPLEVGRLSLLNHGYNTTFRVDTTDGGRYALRLNTNSRKTPAMLRAESAWLSALRRDTDLAVPEPLPTRTGALTTEVDCPELGRPIPAALFGWLRGPNLGAAPSPAALREVGRITAVLHDHTDRWSLPADAELPSFDRVLVDAPYRFDIDHPELTDERRDVLVEAHRRCQAAHDALLEGARRQVIHADIHLHNLKHYRGRLALFDFDDCGLGLPVQDLAFTVYYLRPRQWLEEALYEGYQELRPLPECSPQHFEALVASRNLVLVNDLFATLTAELRDLLPRYLAASVVKLRHFLDTGVFRHDVEGIVPVGW